MKCRTCGADYPDDALQCPQCGAAPDGAEQPSQDIATDTESTDPAGHEPEILSQEETITGAESAAGSSASPEPPAGTAKKSGRLIPVILIALVVICGAAFAAVKFTARDPKQVVIDAFENIVPEGTVYPSEELFGLKEFNKYALTASQEAGMTIKLDNSTDESITAFAGSGLHLEAKEDKTNDKTSLNMGILYNGMDLANMEFYYGEETLMLAVPQLSARVFTADLGEGLADRLKSSPTIRPFLENNGVDVDGLAQYVAELKEQAAAEKTEAPFNIEELMNRYEEGCKAQDNFKAALTVTKGEKSSLIMNGAAVNCKGYQVMVSKASMIDFLRSSSEFFLNDQTLKDDFLKQLETSVRLSELMGGAITGQNGTSARDQQDEFYGEAQKSVDEMITFLDESLTDVQMNVYVDKKGRLASVDGTTALVVNDPETGEVTNADVTFRMNLEGGSYLTQNANGFITLTDTATQESFTFNLTKQGTYDGKQLTCDIAADVSLPDSSAYNVTYTGTYESEGGSYHMGMEVGDSIMPMVSISMTGAVDQLEKGKSFHMNIDELSVESAGLAMAFSGEYYCLPLSGEVTAPEGEAFDVISAQAEEWNSIIMEAYTNIMGIAGQLN